MFHQQGLVRKKHLLETEERGEPCAKRAKIDGEPKNEASVPSFLTSLGKGKPRDVPPCDSSTRASLPRPFQPQPESARHHYITHKAPMLSSSSTWKCDNPQCIHYTKSDLGLNVDYYPKFFKQSVARDMFRELEKQLKPYLEKSQNTVKIMGKVQKIPRKQAAFGDSGLSYNFSGVSVPANPWIAPLKEICAALSEVLGETFNFVLVNRYKDGSDHIGEHRDDEKDLLPLSSIVSVSLGQERDFVFKHRDSRGKEAKRKDIEPVKVQLNHGSVLVMKNPTNTYWYHSLPVRKTAARPRINLTFRQMKVTHKTMTQ